MYVFIFIYICVCVTFEGVSSLAQPPEYLVTKIFTSHLWINLSGPLSGKAATAHTTCNLCSQPSRQAPPHMPSTSSPSAFSAQTSWMPTYLCPCQITWTETTGTDIENQITICMRNVKGPLDRTTHSLAARGHWQKNMPWRKVTSWLGHLRNARRGTD